MPTDLDVGSGSETTRLVISATDKGSVAERSTYVIGGPGSIMLEEGTAPHPFAEYSVLMEDGSSLLIESGINTTDVSIALDAVAGIRLTALDVSATSDIAALSSNLSAAQSVSDVEQPNLIARVQINDPSTGIDTYTRRALYPVSDAGLGASIETLRALSTELERGTTAEAYVFPPPLRIDQTDAGSFLDNQILRALFSLSDSGKSIEAVILKTAIADAQGATGVEAFALRAIATALQVGTGADALSRLLTANNFLAVYNVIAYARKDLLVQYLVLQMVLDDLYAEYDVKGKHIKPAGIITKVGAAA
jgi:hypothetical protein